MCFFAAAYRFCRRKRGLITSLCLLLLALCAVIALRLTVREDITSLMPTDPPGLAEKFAVLREAPILQGLSIAVGGDDPAGSAQVLAKALRSPEIPRVLSGAGQAFTPALLTGLCRSVPGLLRADALAALPARLEETAMRDALLRDRNLLISPQGLALREFLAMDPMAVCSGALRALAPAANALGLRAEQGQLLNAGGTHALVLAEPALSMADSGGAAAVMDRVRAAVDALPEGTEVVVAGGHRHTEENARIIREDVARILPASVLLLAAVFLLFVRRAQGLCLLLLPTAALIVAAAITGLVYGGLSGIVLGFGSVVLGITTDYAIHVYYAFRSGTDPEESLRRVRTPLLLGAGTTLACFAAFSLSSIPCIMQMAFFSLCGILAALLFALFLLPVWLDPGPSSVRSSVTPSAFPGSPEGSRRLKRAPLAVIWCGLGLALVFLLYNTPINGDIRTLSYLSPQTARDEQRLRELFGGLREPSLYALQGESLEEALRANDRVWEELEGIAAQKGWDLPGLVAGLAPLLPAARTQEERALAWRRFWDEHANLTLARLDRVAEETGFSAGAFAPFKDWIRAEPTPMTPQRLTDLGMEVALMLARPVADSWLVYSLVRAESPPPGLLSVLQEHNGVYVSGSTFREAMDAATTRDLLRFGGLSLLAVLGAAVFFFRSPWRAGAALLPVGGGLGLVLAVFFLTGKELNIFHAMALPLVMSLSVDYGIFMLAHLEGRLGKECRTGVLLSGLTTLAGFGMLLLARHPALHSIGLTVSLGLCAALGIALVLLPLLAGPENKEGAGPSPFGKKFWKKEDGGPGEGGKEPFSKGFFLLPPAVGDKSPLSLLAPAALLLAALLVCGGCAARRTLPPPPPPPEYASGVWVFRHRVQLDIPRMRVAQSFDGVMRLEPGKGTAHVVALGGLGMRLFDLVISPDGVHVNQIHPALAKMPGAAERIGKCVANIWFDSLPQMQLHNFSRGDGWNAVFSGPLIAALWPEEIQYTDTRIPFTLKIRLLQAVEETP